MKLFVMILMTALCAGFCGCTTATTSRVETTALDKLNEQYRLVYKKIEDASINIAAISEEVIFHSGQPAFLDITITNNDSKLLHIPEWYQEAGNNFLINFRPFKKDETPEEAINAEWFLVAPEFVKGEQPKHSHLSLAPGNTAIYSVPLDFIEDIPAERDMIFIAYAELNLTSISATSPMFIIVSQSSEKEIEQ